MSQARVLLIALVFCFTSVTSIEARGKKDTVYHRMGGKKGVRNVVEEFISNCAGDSRINGFFAKTAADKNRLDTFKKNLSDQICEVAGGPCKYTGKTMKDAHKGMKLSETDFNALVEDLGKALDKNKVTPADKQTLLSALEPMKASIVE